MLSVEFETHLGNFHLQPAFTAGDDLIVLFGPSGAGKSLTLRALAGLLKPERGRIELPGGVVFDSGRRIDLPPQLRNVGYVVQDLALFPHLTVAANLGFALGAWRKTERNDRIAELVQLLNLQGLEDRLPRSISGGQQQRVALGRALAVRPAVLLLDEPFSALDAPIRSALRREVSGLRRQLALATVFVTHDLAEAYALADRVAVYDAGAVLQCGPRDEVFQEPATIRVAELLEARNVLPGRVLGLHEQFLEIETPWFVGRARPSPHVQAGDRAALSVRPEHVILLRRDRPHSESLDTVLDVELIDETPAGNMHRLYLKLDNGHQGEPCVLEADISAHPYQVMGVANQRLWRVALTLENSVAIPM
jgi:molybdate transport system ATP-binding protein